MRKSLQRLLFRKTCKHLLQLNFVMMLLFLLAIAGVGCSAKAKQKPASSGRILEILVVYDGSKTQTHALPAVEEVFESIQPGLNQAEARFDLVQIRESAFSAIFQNYHSILKIKIQAEASEESIKIQRDKWAHPQLFVEVTAPSDSSANAFIKEKALTLQQLFYSNEYDRIVMQFPKGATKSLADSLFQKQGFGITLPSNFYLAKQQHEKTWLRCRDEEKEMGLLSAVIPYSDTMMLKQERLTTQCDSLIKMIPGSRPLSYMMVVDEYPTICTQTAIDGCYAVELRGLWETKNDLMGGPFLLYAVPFPSRDKVLFLYSYVYHPNQPKRDMLMQLEAIAHSLKFAVTTQ